MVSLQIEMDVEEFIAYSYFASTKTGSKYIRDMGKLTTNYAVNAGKLTGKHLVLTPTKAVAAGTLSRSGRVLKGVARGGAAILRSPVARVPAVGILVGAGLTVYGLYNTPLGKSMRKGEIYRTVRGKVAGL
jgi:hypothetical protein